MDTLIDYARKHEREQKAFTRWMALDLLSRQGKEPPEPTGDEDADFLALLRAAIGEEAALVRPSAEDN